MSESLSFAAWLRTAPEPWFRAFAATRTDLLRTDVTDVPRLSALAASRAAVARGLESLHAPALRVVHRAALLARVNPVIDRGELLDAAADDDPEAALIAAVRCGLLWPATSEEDPAAASAYRVQPEAGGFLPVTAAERARPKDWESAADPRPVTTTRIPTALLENAQGAGAAAATSLALTVVAAFAEREVSQLVSGGVGKRDAQALARAAGTTPSRFALMAEIAAHLGWLATTRDPADPQWKPTPDFDAAAASPREQVWSDLVTGWLTHPVDIAHVIAGVTPAGERIHLLGRDDHARTAFGGFPTARPQILTLRKLVLVALLREGRGADSVGGADTDSALGQAVSTLGQAVRAQDLVALLGFTHPLVAAVDVDEIEQVLDEAELFGLTASPLGNVDAHALTPIGRALAAWVEENDDPFDVLGMRAGLEAGPPIALRDTIAELLPVLETTITLQSDLTGVAFGPLDHEVRMRLEQIGDIDTRGQGTVYRFTDDSITRGLRAGETVDSVLDTLEELSTTGVPTTLEHLVRAAGSRLHRIRVARARSVVVVDDPTDLDILLDDPTAAAIGLRRLTPTVAVADASSDRVSVLLETEDRPILRVDPGADSAMRSRAPVPSPLPATTSRTTRVTGSKIEAHIDGLVARRSAATKRRAAASSAQQARGSGRVPSTGSGGTSASAGPVTAAGNTPVDDAVGQGAAHDAVGDTHDVLATLGEAAAVGTPVDLVMTTSDGTHRTVRLVPQVVQAGRVMGRTDAGKALRISVARIVQVRRTA